MYVTIGGHPVLGGPEDLTEDDATTETERDERRTMHMGNVSK